MLYIDFETRSEVDITKCGAWVYSLHPSTTALCMAYAYKDQPVQLWQPCEPIPKTVVGAIATGEPVEAHNAFFEYSIWVNVMMPKFGWPSIKDEQWRCSMAHAASYALPSQLEQVGTALSLEHQKDKTGHRVMLKLSKPRTVTKNNTAPWHRDQKDFQTMYAYCRQDIEAERELAQTLPKMDPNELRVWQLDQKINKRGIRVDIPAVKAAVKIIEKEKQQRDRWVNILTDGAVKTTGQVSALKDWCWQQGYEIKSVDKEHLNNAFKDPKCPHKVYDVLGHRAAASKTSTAKYAKILEVVDHEDRIRDTLRYHGASTGRWAGKSVQPQNFPRNTFDGDLEDFFTTIKQSTRETFIHKFPNTLGILSQCVRGCFISTEGTNFYGGDFSGIELRKVLWLSGETVWLDKIRNGVDLYVELAKNIFDTQNINDRQRLIGKVCILSGIYQVGKEKFRETLKRVYSVEVSEDFAHRTVQTMRDSMPKLVDFWAEQEQQAHAAVSSRVGRGRGCGPWFIDDQFLFCKLPSGRKLAYYDPKLEKVTTPWGAEKWAVTYMSLNSYTRKWERTYTYGGKLTENISSGSSRDMMVNSMFACEAAGYETVLTVHDELLTEHTEGSEEEFKRLMETVPSWAKDFPLEANVWSGKRYLK